MLSKAFLVFTLAGSLVQGYDRQKPLADQPKSPFTPAFNTFVVDSLNYLHVPGISIAVISGNETFTKGYGIASLPNKNATPYTLYNTASTTKSFTAAAMSLLIDDSANSSNPLKWTTRVSSLIRDDFVLQDEYVTTHATLEDILSHRTGMPRHDLSYGKPGEGIRDLVRNLRNLPMTAEIRTKWQYCNMMFIVASYIIETLTGKWLGDFMRERIWEPLNMTDTVFRVGDADKELLATPYFWVNITGHYVAEKYLEGPQESGEGAIFSNVVDYSKYLRAMIYKASPISPAGHEALRSPRSIIGPGLSFTGDLTYALGWQISIYRGEQIVAHGGAVRGFGTFMAYLPGREWGVVMMSNAMPAGNEVEAILFYKLIDGLLETPEKERLDWKTIADEQNALIREFLANSRKRLFPDEPKEPIPLSLPLKSYTGIYTSIGYGSFNLTLVDATPSSDRSAWLNRKPKEILKLDVRDRLNWEAILEFEHISGEFFLAYGAIPKKDGSREHAGDLKAEFKIGQDGTVKEMGLTLEPMMGEELIWFQKQ
ncbi:MAG: hypothetical protein MMC33_009336 [Icmadophila ericetorum]|nr:hypothetical protein [Icmadophila ericetorum]